MIRDKLLKSQELQELMHFTQKQQKVGKSTLCSSSHLVQGAAISSGLDFHFQSKRLEHQNTKLWIGTLF